MKYVYYKFIDRNTGKPIDISCDVKLINKLDYSESISGEPLLEGDGSWRGLFAFPIGDSQGIYITKWTDTARSVHYGQPDVKIVRSYQRWDFDLTLTDNTTHFSYIDLYNMDNTFYKAFNTGDMPVLKQRKTTDLKYYIKNIDEYGFDIVRVIGSQPDTVNISIFHSYEEPFLITEDISWKTLTLGGGYAYTAATDELQYALTLGGGYKYTCPTHEQYYALTYGGGAITPNLLFNDFDIDTTSYDEFSTYYPAYELKGNTTNAQVYTNTSKVYIHPDADNAIYLDVDIKDIPSKCDFIIHNVLPEEQTSGFTYIPMVWYYDSNNKIVIDYYPYASSTQNKIFIAFMEHGSWTYGRNFYFTTGLTAIDIKLSKAGLRYEGYYKPSNGETYISLGSYTYSGEFYPTSLFLETVGINYNIDKLEVIKT